MYAPEICARRLGHRVPPCSHNDPLSEGPGRMERQGRSPGTLEPLASISHTEQLPTVATASATDMETSRRPLTQVDTPVCGHLSAPGTMRQPHLSSDVVGRPRFRPILKRRGPRPDPGRGLPSHHSEGASDGRPIQADNGTRRCERSDIKGSPGNTTAWPKRLLRRSCAPTFSAQPNRRSSSFTARSPAPRLLRPFAIRSKALWPPRGRRGTKLESGYSRQQFEAAWASYCEPSGQGRRRRLVEGHEVTSVVRNN
jgi:hypothetical protein